MYIYVYNYNIYIYIYVYICINIMPKVQGLNVGNVFAAKPSVSVKLYILNKSREVLFCDTALNSRVNMFLISPLQMGTQKSFTRVVHEHIQYVTVV